MINDHANGQVGPTQQNTNTVLTVAGDPLLIQLARSRRLR